MAADQVQTVNTGADKAKLAASAVLLIASIVGFYVFAKQGALVQWGALIAGLVAATVLFLTSESGQHLIGFGRASWGEAKKVVWPARKEAMQMTAYVFVFVFVMALFLWLTDKALEWAIFDLLLGWRK
jgi:preprotein translocase subunit SecE